jgi:hypothetical protein
VPPFWDRTAIVVGMRANIGAGKRRRGGSLEAGSLEAGSRSG